MNSGGLALIAEIIEKFRPLQLGDRERYAARLGAMVGEEMAAWLVPILLNPPPAERLQELKQALAVYQGFEKFLAEVRDSAAPGARALGVLARWAVAPREPGEEDDGDDADP